MRIVRIRGATVAADDQASLMKHSKSYATCQKRLRLGTLNYGMGHHGWAVLERNLTVPSIGPSRGFYLVVGVGYTRAMMVGKSFVFIQI